MLEQEAKEKKVFIEYFLEPTIKQKRKEVFKRHLGTFELCWMDSIRTYLKDGVVFANRKEARKLMYQATNYALIYDVLYNKGLSLCLPQMPMALGG